MPTSDWARKQLTTLLPLDQDSVSQILEYTATLSNDAAAQHLGNLLGDTPKALEFISAYNSRRGATASVGSVGDRQFVTQAGETEHVPKTTRKQPKKQAPLHQLPARKIDGDGDTSGGYQKARWNEYMASSKGNTANAFELSKTPAAQQQPKKTSGKLPPSAAGTLISDLPNVKTKTQSSSHASSRTGSPAPAKTKVTIQGGTPGKGASSTLEDLDAAIRSLEIQTNPSLASTTSDASRACNCNATRHPLLTAAPNCLSCGKIICLKEGIGPCTFCQTPLLTSTDITTMLTTLKQERGTERQRMNNASHSRAPTTTTNTTASSSSSPRQTPISAPPARSTTITTTQPHTNNPESLNAALAHKSKLLTFQSENAQRTTIRDEAADLADPVHGVNRWAMDPSERARQLRMQQKAMREQEERARPEWESRGRVLEIEVGKGGGVVKRWRMGKGEEQGVGANEKPDAADHAQDGGAAIEGGEPSVHSTTGGRFSHNPLLEAGGMVRPLWQPDSSRAAGGVAKGKEKERSGGAKTEEVKGWRRGMEDNEEIILNGGAYGRDRRLGEEERAVG